MHAVREGRAASGATGARIRRAYRRPGRGRRSPDRSSAMVQPADRQTEQECFSDLPFAPQAAARAASTVHRPIIVRIKEQELKSLVVRADVAVLRTQQVPCAPRIVASATDQLRTQSAHRLAA